jgi:uncharacterized surface protein with fasciclin (FAS1) repeats
MAIFLTASVPAAPTAHTDCMKNRKLLSALKSASLIDMLRSPGKHAILAPTDAVFHRLSAGSLDALFKSARTLEPFLCNHMMAGVEAANT